MHNCSYSLIRNVGTQKTSVICSLPSFPLDNNWTWCVNGDSSSPTLRPFIQTIYSNEFRALNKPEVSRGLRRNCRLLSNVDDSKQSPTCEDITSWSALNVLLVFCVSQMCQILKDKFLHPNVSKTEKDWITRLNKFPNIYFQSNLNIFFFFLLLFRSLL